jgi:hypothetical protein
MEILIFLVLLTTLALTAMRFGADSRDGKPNWPSSRHGRPIRRPTNASTGTRSLMGRLVRPRGSRSAI